MSKEKLFFPKARFLISEICDLEREIDKKTKEAVNLMANEIMKTSLSDVAIMFLTLEVKGSRNILIEHLCITAIKDQVDGKKRPDIIELSLIIHQTIRLVPVEQIKKSIDEINRLTNIKILDHFGLCVGSEFLKKETRYLDIRGYFDFDKNLD